MLLRRTPKSVWCVARSGRSFSAATKAKRNDTENETYDTSNHVTIKGKRLDRSQRRAMVEAFVNQYKAMNTGKVPSFVATRKKVGGSYYIVKNILQELEHSAKTRDSNKTSTEKVEAKERRCSSKSMASSESETGTTRTSGKNVESSSSSLFDKPISEKDCERNFDSSSLFGGSTRSQTNLVEERSEGDIFSPGSEESSSSRINGDRMRRASEDSQESGVLKDKTGSEKMKGEHKQSVPTSLVVKDRKESSVWVSIKSFADGFINIWRKS